VDGQYKWDILLSQQMLDTIKDITDDSFFFQENSTQEHCVYNTITHRVKYVIFLFFHFAR